MTCTISGLAPGSSTPVYVVVTPSAAGRYVNHVTVADPPGQTDPNPTDNSATATLDVTNPQSKPAAPPSKAPPLRRCLVPKLLKGMPSGKAKRLLKLLGCNVKIKHRRRPGVAKGAVLATKPGAGTYRFRRKVTLIVAASAPARA